MTFMSPDMLYVLLALPPMAFAYLYKTGRVSPWLVRYPGLVPSQAGPRWHRHVPFALLALAFLAIGVALGRPAAVVALPSEFDTVILAMDVSGSMRATDIEPSRLIAAQAAARAFVAAQPRKTRVGLVAFGDKAAVLQQPTHDRGEITAAIDQLYLKSGTAIGAGIVAAMATLFPDQGFTDDQPGGNVAPIDIDTWRNSGVDPSAPAAAGPYTSAAIVLLSDGESTSGPDVIEAARAAADRGVRVYTVGLGTTEGEVVAFDGWRSRVHLDEKLLQEIAETTGAEYFQAQSAGELTRIYATLSTQSIVEKKELELTALFAAAAALFAVLSAGLSMLWFQRIL